MKKEDRTTDQGEQATHLKAKGKIKIHATDPGLDLFLEEYKPHAHQHTCSSPSCCSRGQLSQPAEVWLMPDKAVWWGNCELPKAVTVSALVVKRGGLSELNRSEEEWFSRSAGWNRVCLHCDSGQKTGGFGKKTQALSSSPMNKPSTLSKCKKGNV